MADRIQPGQILSGYSSADHNEFADAAEAIKKFTNPTSGAERLNDLPAAALAEVEVNQDREALNIVAISAPMFTPDEDPEAPYRGPVSLRSKTPTADDTQLAILQQDAASGQAVPAVLVGSSWARVDLQSTSDTTCGPIDGDATKLRSGSGPVTILWKPDGQTGEQWCLVLLGGGGGGPAATAVVGSLISDPSDDIPAATGTTFGSLTTEQKTAIENSLGRTPDDSEAVVVAGYSNTIRLWDLVKIEAANPQDQPQMFAIERPLDDPDSPEEVFNLAPLPLHTRRLLVRTRLGAVDVVTTEMCG